MLNQIHSMSKVQKISALVQHILNKCNKNQQCTFADAFLTRHYSTPNHKKRFLYRTIIVDETWCFVSILNEKQKQSGRPKENTTLQAKQDLYPRKTMLCAQQDWNKTDRICETALYYNTVTPDLTSNTSLGSATSPSILSKLAAVRFSSFSNAFRGVSIKNDVELRALLDEFFKSRPKNFYHRKIQ